MSLDQKQQQIIDEFSIYDDWMDKYEYLIEIGKDLPVIDERFRTDDKLIEGCQSKVWLHSEINDGLMHFYADSDAIITKGIIALLIRVFDNETPQNIATCDPYFIREIGLQEHLSPTRANGLASMVKRMKMNALMAINNKTI